MNYIYFKNKTNALPIIIAMITVLIRDQMYGLIYKDVTPLLTMELWSFCINHKNVQST